MGCKHSRSDSAELDSSGPTVELIPLPSFGREPPNNDSKPLPRGHPHADVDTLPAAVVLFREAFMSDPTPQSAARRNVYEARRDAVLESTPRLGAPHALFTQVSKTDSEDVPRATHAAHETNPEVRF